MKTPVFEVFHDKKKAMKQILWLAIAKLDRKLKYRFHSGEWVLVLDRPWMVRTVIIGPSVVVGVVAIAVTVALQAAA